MLKTMRAQLEAAYAKEDKLISDLEVFGINQPKNPDLIKLEKELQILESIWETVYQWSESWLEYKNGNFWSIDISTMEDNSVILFRKLTKMCKMYKDKNYEILETTRREVDEFRKTLPLITALKNPCMRARHWQKVRDLVQMLVELILKILFSFW